MWRKIINFNRSLVLGGDIIAIILGHVVAYLLRFELDLSVKALNQMLTVLPYMIPIKLGVFYLFGLYRGMWRYTGLNDLFRLFHANLVAQLLIITVLALTTRFAGYSRSVFVIDGVFCFLFCTGLRTCIRLYFSISDGDKSAWGGLLKRKQTDAVNTLIVGAGRAAEALIREVLGNQSLNYKLIGLVDDDRGKLGLGIHGVPVLGAVDDLKELAQDHAIGQILIAIPSASGKQMRRIIAACEGCNVEYKTLPGLGELIDGKAEVKTLRDVSYEDLLGRPPVDLDDPAVANYLAGRTVLITGAGGSIGSELCRQVARFNPKHLVLLDANEFNVFRIENELKSGLGQSKITAVLGRVQDRGLMNKVFSIHRPDVVFHAAAYKHVPLVERNPWEGVFNNIVGSMVTMRAALAHGVKRFVLVSTDKAVRPTNVMGACKRVTELIMQSLSRGATKFMAVRFGNVVGSSGSVIPFFRRQIEQGGPVTVTHPEATRFFMTIPEASRLILQAGSMGQGGEIFILEMGTSVKIAEMAEDLIRLSGKEPHRDVEIVFTGMRDGEKLYEELITHGEGILETRHEKIMVLGAESLCNGFSDHDSAFGWLENHVEELCNVATSYDGPQIKAKLQKIVPEYEAQENLSVVADEDRVKAGQLDAEKQPVAEKSARRVVGSSTYQPQPI